jgi:hypothetical protein
VPVARPERLEARSCVRLVHQRRPCACVEAAERLTGNVRHEKGGDRIERLGEGYAGPCGCACCERREDPREKSSEEVVCEFGGQAEYLSESGGRCGPLFCNNSDGDAGGDNSVITYYAQECCEEEAGRTLREGRRQTVKT